MICHDVRARLDALLDGELPLPERRAVETHLAGCAACRAGQAQRRRLRDEARALPDRIDPPEDLWPAIDRAIDAAIVRPLPRRPREVRWRRIVLATAAALAIAATSSWVTWWIVTGEHAAPATVALDAARTVEADYAEATADLERALAERRGTLRPETIAVLERNLRVIDAAITEARAALRQDPGNRALTERLLRVHAMKLDLLQRAVQL